MRIQNNEHALTVVSLYSQPDPTLMASSSNTVLFCLHKGNTGLAVISVKCIIAGIAMVPHTVPTAPTETRYFVMEKLGLDIVSMDGIIEEMVEETVEEIPECT